MMSGDFGEFHDELRTVARELLGKAGDAAVEWKALAGAGWTGLEVAAEFDGAAATFTETAILLEEIGRAAARTPYPAVATTGIGALCLLEPNTRRDVVLRETVAGTARPVAVLAGNTVPAAGGETACAGTGGIVPTFELDQTGKATLLSGSAEFVLDAPSATVLLIPARAADGTLGVALADAGSAGLEITGQPVVDETRIFGKVTSWDMALAPESFVPFAPGVADPLRQLYDRAVLAAACDSLGLAAAMLDATVGYTRVREQFGRPIGSFQAVKHACADMLVELTIARQLVAAAVTATAAGTPDSGRSVSMAKSFTGEAAVRIAGGAVQLHGGIGYTWESGLHRYLKRATLDRALYGSPADHRHALARSYANH
ncbi:acyl-CoA dehydrogenase family protein [Nocardia carnea]|uniref:acyl-CoA dehydrogenase family protein n=1 Tax=Nocardia carnea TaxID=37328 RepID=UPI002456311B|nr:acyl-CoA dehydrogenase family protein [Nocardia carnea]